ncbi:MAG TPA: hypothetical protein VKU41_08345 [Polyangiaceae bacterium]|nr:hypothetical protein [Polyangiaceae bacterium]
MSSWPARRCIAGSGTFASASQVMPVSRQERKSTCLSVRVSAVSLGRVTPALLSASRKSCARNLSLRSRRAGTIGAWSLSRRSWSSTSSGNRVGSIGMVRTAFAVVGIAFAAPVRASIALLTDTVRASRSTSSHVSASSSSGRT